MSDTSGATQTQDPQQESNKNIAFDDLFAFVQKGQTEDIQVEQPQQNTPLEPFVSQQVDESKGRDIQWGDHQQQEPQLEQKEVVQEVVQQQETFTNDQIQPQQNTDITSDGGAEIGGGDTVQAIMESSGPLTIDAMLGSLEQKVQTPGSPQMLEDISSPQSIPSSVVSEQTSSVIGMEKGKRIALAVVAVVLSIVGLVFFVYTVDPLLFQKITSGAETTTNEQTTTIQTPLADSIQSQQDKESGTIDSSFQDQDAQPSDTEETNIPTTNVIQSNEDAEKSFAGLDGVFSSDEEKLIAYLDTIDALEAKTKIVLDAATEAQDNKQQAIAKAILKNVLKIRKDIDTMEDIDFDVLQTGIDELENLFADKLASQE